MSQITSIPTTLHEMKAFLAGETWLKGAQPGQHYTTMGGVREHYRSGFGGRQVGPETLSQADADWLAKAGLYASQAAGTDNQSLAAALERAMARHNFWWAAGRIGPNDRPWTW